MTTTQPRTPADETGRSRHATGQQWPECGCRLCMDDYICPAAVTRIGRALVLTAALGVVGVVVSAL